MNSPLLIAAPTQLQLITHALGWTLLHFLWQGALIAFLLACVLSLFDARSPQPRYVASCTALLLMIAAPIATFARILSASRGSAHAVITVISVDPVTVRPIGSPSEPLLQRLAETLDHRMPIVLVIWSAGVLLLLSRLIIGLIVARRMKSVATQPPTRDLLHTFHHLTHRIGVSRPVRLLHSALVQVPTVIGWLRPVVLIPFGCLANLSPTQLEAILAHELAHIRRHDYLISVLQSVVEAVLFYHPAVWWVSQRIRLEREHCCDDLAVNIGGDPLTYARALSLLAEQSLALPAISLAANGGILTMRIKRLLSPRESPASSQLAAVTILALIIAVSGLSIGATARAQSSRNQTQPTPAASPSSILVAEAAPATPSISSKATLIAATPQLATNNQQSALPPIYERWVDEDARWIITPEERAAFLNLSNDEQRDLFIQNFWLRRDPAGSAPNTTRSQHYQRIAYSNQHFGDTGIPGWSTDRGHVYIVNGPPDTIDSHPSADGHPYEIWRYTSAPGLGGNVELKFVDICNCGNYKLQSQPNSAASSAAMPSADLSQVSIVVSSSTPDTPYPPIARAARVSGTVLLLGTISKSGTMENLKIVSGPQMLRSTALAVVQQKSYPRPGVAPMPADTPSKIEVTFILDDAKAGPKPDAKAPQQRNPSPAIRRVSYVPAAAPLPPPSSDSTPPAKIRSEVMAGQVASKVTPVYPAAAKAGHIEGVVVLHAIISTEGNVTTLEVVSGPEELRASALDAVRRWKYKSYLVNGQPTEVETNITVNYHLGYSEDLNPPPPDDERAADGTAPRRIGNGVSAPQVIYQVEPEFSDEAKQDKTFTGGHVLVHLLVDQQGNPQNVRVLRGIGHGLDQQAILAIRQYKFKPALENGNPVLVSLNIEVNFQRF